MQRKISDPQTNLTLGGLSDVDTAGAIDDYVLTYNSGLWSPSPVSGSIAEPDTQVLYGTGASVTSDPTLIYDQPTNTLTVGDLLDSGLIESGAGQELVIDGIQSLRLKSTNGVVDIQSEVYLNGAAGDSGYIFTSDGPGNAPYWSLPSGGGTVSNVAYYMQPLSPSPVFNGDIFTTWVVNQLGDLSPLTPIVTWNGSDRYTAEENAIIKITVLVKINVPVPGPLPAGDIAYGTQFELGGGSMFTSDSTQHVRYAANSSVFSGAASFPAQINTETITWTDIYIWQAAASNQMYPYLYLYSPTSPADIYSPIMTVSFEKISDYTPI
jgi:hypothetical protein